MNTKPTRTARVRTLSPGWAVIALAAVSAGPLGAQGIVVDQGTFEITVDGRTAGTEEFVLRRAGLARVDKIFANGTLSLNVGGAEQTATLILRADPAVGMTEQYEAEVRGVGAATVRVVRANRRYVATIRSLEGSEDREFQARASTRVLERDVAHHYHFTGELAAGELVHVLEPRSRSQMTMTTGAHEATELDMAGRVVPARRVTFTASESDLRTVWFDRQGRVLRVEVPARRYVAQRTDLVG